VRVHKVILIDTEGKFCGKDCLYRSSSPDGNFSFHTVYTCDIWRKQLVDEGNFRTKRCEECLK
jgi:hypothetical protein